MNLLVKGGYRRCGALGPVRTAGKTQLRRTTREKGRSDRGATTVLVDTSLYTLAFNMVTTKEKFDANKGRDRGHAPRAH